MNENRTEQKTFQLYVLSSTIDLEGPVNPDAGECTIIFTTRIR